MESNYHMYSSKFVSFASQKELVKTSEITFREPYMGKPIRIQTGDFCFHFWGMLISRQNILFQLHLIPKLGHRLN